MKGLVHGIVFNNGVTAGTERHFMFDGIVVLRANGIGDACFSFRTKFTEAIASLD
jgi:hypothetical protein